MSKPKLDPEAEEWFNKLLEAKRVAVNAAYEDLGFPENLEISVATTKANELLDRLKGEFALWLNSREQKHE